MKTSKLLPFILCALFAALTAVCSQIGFSVGPIPFNLATFAVLLAGGLLGAKYGALSQIVYVLLGFCGAPVFSLMRSGPQMLAGPTGGFIIGYIIAAFVVGLLTRRLPEKLPKTVLLMAIGPLCYFLPGFLWFMIITGNGAWSSLTLSVLPYLPGDAVKVVLAALLTKRLRPILAKSITALNA